MSHTLTTTSQTRPNAWKNGGIWTLQVLVAALFIGRRTGLIEFEVSRAPDQLDRRIANACHTSAATVRTVRRNLLAADEQHAADAA